MSRDNTVQAPRTGGLAQLDPRLYSPLQVLAYQDVHNVPDRHPAWWHSDWTTHAHTCEHNGRPPCDWSLVGDPGSPARARRAWDTPGLPACTEQERCGRHRGMCAYRDDDPGRCPECHRSWARLAFDDDPHVHPA